VLGVLTIEEAIAAAEERGLDLVEVAPTARPPVVKIMDYGKYKFEEAKAARAAKKKQHVIDIKEVKFRPGIDDHDFDFKTRHMREFLGERANGGGIRGRCRRSVLHVPGGGVGYFPTTPFHPLEIIEAIAARMRGSASPPGEAR